MKIVPDMNRVVSATKPETARRESVDVIVVLADPCAKISVTQSVQKVEKMCHDVNFMCKNMCNSLHSGTKL